MDSGVDYFSCALISSSNPHSSLQHRATLIPTLQMGKLGLRDSLNLLLIQRSHPRCETTRD